MKEKEKRPEAKREEDWWRPLGLHLEYIDVTMSETLDLPFYKLRTKW